MSFHCVHKKKVPGLPQNTPELMREGARRWRQWYPGRLDIEAHARSIEHRAKELEKRGGQCLLCQKGL